jgi:type VI secretion system secreted protein VgrG
MAFMQLDIKTAVNTFVIIAVIGGILAVLFGTRLIRSGQQLKYFRKRRDMMMRGWRMILGAVFLGILAFVSNRFAEPVAYRFFPPSPTAPQTATITLTPTITRTPTVTLTPSITVTPEKSNTPSIPLPIESQFSSEVTPNAESIFSIVQFAEEIDENRLLINPTTEFENPVETLYGAFSYDRMLDGVQWTALWYRVNDWSLVCYETKPWDGSTGGYGYSDCSLETEWIPGEYEVQIFVGKEWKSSGRFFIIGEIPTEDSSVSETLETSGEALEETAVPTIIEPDGTRTSTPSPTFTRRPSLTSTITPTERPSSTPRPTDTRWPSPTPTFTETPRPTKTPLPTDTRWPTNTPRP